MPFICRFRNGFMNTPSKSQSWHSRAAYTCLVYADLNWNLKIPPQSHDRVV